MGFGDLVHDLNGLRLVEILDSLPLPVARRFGFPTARTPIRGSRLGESSNVINAIVWKRNFDLVLVRP